MAARIRLILQRAISHRGAPGAPAEHEEIMTGYGIVGRARRYAACSAMALLLLGGGACRDTLSVSNPQAFTNGSLDDVKILAAVADGAEGAMQQSFDDFIVFTGLLSDEIEDSSTWIDWADVSLGRVRGDWPTAPGFATAQDDMQRARYAAQDAKARIIRVLGADPASKSPLMAQVMAVDGWADLYLGMGWCEAPLVSGGVRANDTELIKQAITKLTAAIATAQASGNSAVLNWALAGRARANLFAGNYDAALADAQAVPAGFLKQALYSVNSQTSFTGGQLNQNRNRSGTLRRLWWPMVDTTGNDATPTPDQFVKDPWALKNDPRMVVVHPRGRLGVNNSTLSYSFQKYKDYAAPINMTSKREMNLIEAEVYWRKGDLGTAIAKLNLNRTSAPANLPAFTGTFTAQDVQDRLLSERFAELFVEGHRLMDLNRFNLITARLGPGRATKLPLSRNEILNNANMKQGDAKCPSIS